MHNASADNASLILAFEVKKPRLDVLGKLKKPNLSDSSDRQRQKLGKGNGEKKQGPGKGSDKQKQNLGEGNYKQAEARKEQCRQQCLAATNCFEKTFVENSHGSVCSVCDRVRFVNDVTKGKPAGMHFSVSISA